MISEEKDATILRTFAAREEIKELRARYCWHAARGDYIGISEIFTPTGVFELMADGARNTHRGRAAIASFLAERIRPGMVFPMIQNDIIAIEGDTAHSTCVMHSHTATLTLSGYYHDQAVIHEGRWLFSERRFFLYTPVFERSGLDLDGKPETGLAAQRARKLAPT